MTVFLVSTLISVMIIYLKSHLKFLLNPRDLQGDQKFHTIPTPRVGGISVFFSFFLGLWLLPQGEDLFVALLFSSLPLFIGGMTEDLSANVSPLVRMSMILASILIAFITLDVGIFSLDIGWVDRLLSDYYVLSLAFTLLVVAGLVNAINIIDGYNGLMIGYSVLVLLAVAYVAHMIGDSLIVQLSLLLIFSLFGVLVFNFPLGRIFMGDGGAYFVGFMMALISLMLGIRNTEVTHWFALLLFIYPLFETVFSIYRKKIIKGMPSSQPDGCHLHMLVYKNLIKCHIFKGNQIICNSMTSPILWMLSLTSIVPAVIWFDHQAILILCALVFMLLYVIIYRWISSLKPNV